MNNMTNEEKGKRYDELVRAGDDANRQISKLKSQDTGLGLTREAEKELKELQNKLVVLEQQLNSLFI